MIKRILLTASEGMILTDGEIYGRTVYLAQGADESRFYEISQEEFEEIQKRKADENRIG